MTPHLWAHRTPDGRYHKVYCPRCRRWHTHGRLDGHFIAHCPIGKGFEDYVLVAVEASLDEIKAHNEEACRG
jgi:hypothetical protein